MGAKLAGRSGVGRGRYRAHSAMSEINVTPFVDVMLVLLVVFMITAPLLTAGVDVNLPKEQAKAISQQDNTPLEISIDSKGGIFMGETSVTKERMTALLQALAEENAERRVYIRADNGLSYGQVMGVMAAVNVAGFTKVALVTDPSMRSN